MSAQATRGGLTYPLRCGRCGADFIFSLITNTTSLALRPLSAADLARPVVQTSPPPAESAGLDVASFTQSDPPPLPPLRPVETLAPVPAVPAAGVPDPPDPVAVPDTLDPDVPRPHPSTVSFAIDLAPVPPERSTVSFLRPDLPPEPDAVVAEFSTHGGGHSPTDSASRPVPPADSSIARPAPNPTQDMPSLAPPPSLPVAAAPLPRPTLPRPTLPRITPAPAPPPPPPPPRQDFVWVDPPDAVESVFGEVAPESQRPAPPPPTEGAGTGAWEPVSPPVTSPPPPAAPPPPPRPPAAPLISRVQPSDAARGWGALLAIVLATAVAVGAVAAVAIVLLRPPAAGP